MRPKLSLKIKFLFWNTLIIALSTYFFMTLSFKEFNKMAESFSEDVVNQMKKEIEQKLYDLFLLGENLLEKERDNIEFELNYWATNKEIRDLVINERAEKKKVEDELGNLILREYGNSDKASIYRVLGNLKKEIYYYSFAGVKSRGIEIVTKDYKVSGRTSGFPKEFREEDGSYAIKEVIDKRTFITGYEVRGNSLAIKAYKGIFEENLSDKKGAVLITLRIDTDFINNLKKIIGLNIRFYSNSEFIIGSFLDEKNDMIVFDSENEIYEKLITEKYYIKEEKIYLNKENQHYKTVFIPIKDYLNKNIGMMAISLSTKELENSIILFEEQKMKKQNQLKERIKNNMLIFLLFSIIAVYFILSKLISRINRVKKSVKNIANGNFEDRIKVIDSDEIGELSYDFNTMAEKLDESFKKEKEYSKEIENLNKDLEKKVEERTKEIENLYEEMKIKNEKLLVLDKLKDDFLANTSHELRTPLNGIIGITESLIDGIAGKLNKETEKNMKMIILSAKRLVNLVNDILDFSKLKNQEIALNIKEVDIKKIAEEVIKLLNPLIQNKDLKIYNNISSDFKFVLCDENRLQQIFNNLIGNAIKFTEKGKIEIGAYIENENAAIYIKDTGIGIAKEKQKIIFESFQQAEESISRNYGGTGLGLSITKRLIELQGGKIEIESELGKGTKFIFYFPYSDKRKSNEIDNQEKKYEYYIQENDFEKEIINDISKYNFTDVKKGKILVVDDEPINLQVLSNYLLIENYEIVSAPNGYRAFEILEENKYNFDIVLTDVMMPGMSGHDLCKLIRKTQSMYKLPIIMITAKSRPEDIAEGLSCGANDYITKPIEKLELYARTETHISLKKAVENAILINKKYENEKEVREVTEKINDMTKALSKILILKEVLKIFIDKLHENLNYKKAICLLNENQKFNILIKENIEISENFDFIKNNEFIFKKLKNKNEIIEISEVNISDDMQKIYNCLVIPIIYNLETIALIVLSFEENKLKENNNSFINAVSSQAAIAMENAKLFEKIKKQGYELAVMIEELKTIEDLVSVVYTERNERKAIDYILNLITSEEILNYKKALYLNWDEINKKLTAESYVYNFSSKNNYMNSEKEIIKKEYERVTLGKEKDEISLNDVSISLEDNSKIKESFCNKKIINFYDYEEDFIEIADIKFEKYCILPVYYLENIYGVLILEVEQEKRYDENLSRIDILKIFATNLSIYLENVRLGAKALEKERLETMVKLAEAIVHEVRTPLVGIKGFASIVRNKYLNVSNDEKERKKVYEYMKYIEKEAERIDEMAIELLDYAGKEQYIYKFEKIKIYENLNKILENMKKDIEINKIKINFELEENLEITGDLKKINMLFTCLLKNSIENIDFSKDENVITIKKIKKEKEIIIILEDNGVGIPENIKKDIFKPLISTKIQGTGLGLAIVEDIVKKHKAEINIESKEGEGTTVNLVFRNEIGR